MRRAGASLHGPELGDVVLVTGSDGHRVALALSGLDPGARCEHVILATQRDGAQLDSSGVPFQLVIEGDLRPVRAARKVEAITSERIDIAPGVRDDAPPTPPRLGRLRHAQDRRPVRPRDVKGVKAVYGS